MKRLVVEDVSARPSFLRRTYDALACWWVLLRARIAPHNPDPRLEHCLQVQKGTRFRLSGGQLDFLEEASVQEEGDQASAKSYVKG